MRALGDSAGLQGFIGTPDRMAALRGVCLVRDRHRCVVTRRFDAFECKERYARAGANACDDDGVLFSQQPQGLQLEKLEVAHILPHSLMKANDNKELVC